MRQPVAVARAHYERFRPLIHQFAKFAVIGVSGVFITNAVYERTPWSAAGAQWLSAMERSPRTAEPADP